jgi:cytochrome P450
MKVIRRGLADFMLAGGYDSMLNPVGLSGFCLLGALSTDNDTPTRASRPFDATRNGFVLGEGAGFLVLEEWESARRRGAHIYAELAGDGNSLSSYRITDSPPDGDGPIQAIEQAMADAGLTPSEVVRFCQLLVAAGTETTTNLISNAMLCLADHPDARDRLPEAIEEVLRHRTPVQAMFRATRTDLELEGVRIPAGRMVIACIGAANRDAEMFADPDRFDVARAPNPHLAFGHGIHYCLGASLSRLEARIALGDLLARFPRFELERDWRPRGSFHVHGPAALRMRLTK